MVELAATIIVFYFFAHVGVFLVLCWQPVLCLIGIVLAAFFLLYVWFHIPDIVMWVAANYVGFFLTVGLFGSILGGFVVVAYWQEITQKIRRKKA